MPSETLELDIAPQLTGSEWTPSATTSSMPSWAILSDEPRNRRMLRYRFSGGELSITITGSVPTWMVPTLQSMGELLSLPENWDSYGALRVSPDRVNAAMTFMLETTLADTPVPSVVPTSSGGVQIEWHTKGIDLEVEFVTSSRLRAFFEDRRTGRCWERDLSSDLSDVAEAIATLSRRV